MSSRTPPRSLASAFDPRRNALNAMRLALAAAVVLAHAWPLAGWPAAPSAGGLSIGDWAVGAFFAISGFLITRSRLRTPLSAFVVRRFVRIYPAYLVVTVVIAFVFAPFAVLALGEPSWDVRASASFVLRNLFLKVLQVDIPGTLDHVAFPGAWNGSAWTLAYEFGCYLMIGLLVTLLPRRLLVGGVVAGLIVASGSALALDAQLVSLPTSVSVAFRPTAFFFGGALVFLLADRLPARAWLACTMLMLIVLGSVTGLTVLVAPVPLAYLCILVGAWFPGDPLTTRHDVSYGVYLYGFPVGQLLAHVLVAPAAQPWAVAGITLLATIPFAVASWLLVERPTMRLTAPRTGRSGRHRRIDDHDDVTTPTVRDRQVTSSERSGDVPGSARHAVPGSSAASPAAEAARAPIGRWAARAGPDRP
ncbi:acyltransferase family protein [Curtobacterium sp. L1-20]|uniref:acyltransferase family protein n=1 Tax=Curtobacterium sp. L1-20 TaxID=3138181 RepID=UPI003B52CF23